MKTRKKYNYLQIYVSTKHVMPTITTEEWITCFFIGLLG